MMDLSDLGYNIYRDDGFYEFFKVYIIFKKIILQGLRGTV